MLRSPTTGRGTSGAGEWVSGETKWTLWSQVLVEQAFIILKQWNLVPKRGS